MTVRNNSNRHLQQFVGLTWSPASCCTRSTRTKPPMANKVVLQALRSVPKTTSSYITSYTTAFLYEWVLDLTTGTVVQERCLNPHELVEFPAIDGRHHGLPTAQYAYCIHVSSIGGPIATLRTPREGILIDGLVKFALRDIDGDGGDGMW